MVISKSLVSLALISSVIASPLSIFPQRTGCGEWPSNHPTVIKQGWDPAMVDAALKADGVAVIAAGYNYLSVLLGPEVDEPATLGKSLEGTVWTVAVTGFGVRGSNSSALTAHMENTLQLFREKAPTAIHAFNRSPDSTLEAVKRWAPLDGDCTNSPGKKLGADIYCDASVCTQPL